MKFEVTHIDKNTNARVGILNTDRGKITTPIFMPVGTQGTVKAVDNETLTEDIEAQIILGNTYHLYLRPGVDTLMKAGGLHRFMGWQRPLLTDSGGYQVYSLAQKRKISEEGVRFQSHIDGSVHLFTPESVVDVQRSIGSDIMMAFDECPPYPSKKEYILDSMHRTHRWLDRCIEQMQRTTPHYDISQSLFPIVQGGEFRDLRTQSAEFVAQKQLDGYAIGGLSVGEPSEMMYEMTELVCGILPKDKPRYLMGVGTPANILESVALGVDMFDCVMPTRNARNGYLFTTEGIINIKNKKWQQDFSPIDKGLNSPFSQTSKSYLRHLIISNERLGAQIASVQNLKFYTWMMGQIREKIAAGTFYEWKEKAVLKFSERI